MSDWSNLRNNLPPSQGGQIQFKLDNEVPTRMRVIGEPYVYQGEYKGQPNTRFAVSAWDYATKSAKVFILPRTPIEQIIGYATNTEWGNPEMYDLTITKKVSGDKTDYMVQPSPNKSALPDDQRQQVEALDVVVLLNRLPGVQFAMSLNEANQDTYKTAQSQSSDGDLGPTWTPTDDDLNAVSF